MITEYTFYELIDKNIIEIPIIQRDYAQGRTSTKVTELRDRFVKSMLDKIVRNEKMHLGFVYGKIEGKDKNREILLHKQAVNTLLGSVTQYAEKFNIKVNSEVISDAIELSNIPRFIPLDGQQRLTTLYLLYWYIAMRKGESFSGINNFKYNNRKFALDFCKEISRSENVYKIKNELKKELDVQLKGAPWFLDKWKNDATVSGMLVMLKKIHEEFNALLDFSFDNIEVKSLPFSFDFLDLSELDQSDELYIKMNERGKQLTDFEHFKAWLQDKTAKDYQSQADKSFLEQFWVKMDTEWLEFFWRQLDDVNYTALDDLFYNYLKTMAMNHHLSTLGLSDLPEQAKDLWQLVNNGDTYTNQDSVTYIPLSKFSYLIGDIKYDVFSIEALKFINTCFEFQLSDNRQEYLESLEPLLSPVFSKGNILNFYLKGKQFTPNYWDHAMYFSILKFYQTFQEPSNSFFVDWMRILRNLIYNTQIQNPENLYNALKSLNSLFLVEDSKSNPLSSLIQEESFATIKFFSDTQYTEEKLKAKYIVESEWKEQILNLEKHNYFYGRIGFILNLSKSEEGIFDIGLFTDYGRLLSDLFEKDTDEFLLQRALLTCEDYLIESSSSNHSFCSTDTATLRNRNENWRRVFQDEKRRKILKRLLDKLLYLKDLNAIERLREVIINSDVDKEDWRFYFINEPYTIKQCKSQQIREFNPNNIRLLQNKAITGYHLELRSIYYLKQLKPVISQFEILKELKFTWDKSTNGHPGIGFKDIQIGSDKFNMEIKFLFDGSNCFDLWLEKLPDTKQPFTEGLKELFIKETFIEKENDIFLLSVHRDELIDKVKDLEIKFKRHYRINFVN